MRFIIGENAILYIIVINVSQSGIRIALERWKLEEGYMVYVTIVYITNKIWHGVVQ